MCGLVFVERKSNNNVNNTVLKRFRAQINRGTSGFAFVSTDENGKVLPVTRASRENDIVEALKNNIANRTLFHHRIPTSTVNVPPATHPIVVSNDMLEFDYYVVHNGVITNDTHLRKKHEEMGFVYTTVIKNQMTYRGVDDEIYWDNTTKETFNDSEALAIELALFLEGKSKSIGTSGSVAFICMKTDKEGNALEMYFGHNDGNPLVLEDNGDMLCIKSEGHGVELKADVLFSYSLLDDERNIKQVPTEIGMFYGRKSAYTGMGYNANYNNDDVEGVCYDSYERGRSYCPAKNGMPAGYYKNGKQFIEQKALPFNKLDWDDVEGGSGLRWNDDRGLVEDDEYVYDGTVDPNDLLDELCADIDAMEGEIEAIQDEIKKAQSRDEDTFALRDELQEMIKEKNKLQEQLDTLEYGSK